MSDDLEDRLLEAPAPRPRGSTELQAIHKVDPTRVGA